MRTALVVKAAQITASTRGEALNCLFILCLLVGFGQTSQGEHGHGASRSYRDTASSGYGPGSALPGLMLGLPHLMTPSGPSNLLNCMGCFRRSQALGPPHSGQTPTTKLSKLACCVLILTIDNRRSQCTSQWDAENNVK